MDVSHAGSTASAVLEPSPRPAPEIYLDSQQALIVASQRLPDPRWGAAEDSRDCATRSLAAALMPLISEASVAWVGLPDPSVGTPTQTLRDGLRYVPVELGRDEVAAHAAVCVETLWPLYHHCVREPRYSRELWSGYVAVNRGFAKRVAQAAPPRASVWIHDHCLQLVPAMVRALRPDLDIGFFLHTPFPHRELFRRLPWRDEVLEGMLGADLVGFQTTSSAANFLHLAQEHSGGGCGPEIWTADGRRVRTGVFPTSIDVDRIAALAGDPATLEKAREIRRRVGRGQRLLLAVDPLEATSGIDVRLESFRQWLRSHSAAPPHAVLIQVAIPSAQEGESHAGLRRRVEGLVGQINGEFGEVDHAPVHYVLRAPDLRELVALYLAADVMLVTPLADGMSLHAKEYVAARADAGVLMLSEFAGAAEELEAALRVNPHDVGAVCGTLDRALALDGLEQRRRMRSLRRAVEGSTARDWAGGFLAMLRQSVNGRVMPLAGLA